MRRLGSCLSRRRSAEQAGRYRNTARQEGRRVAVAEVRGLHPVNVSRGQAKCCHVRGARRHRDDACHRVGRLPQRDHVCLILGVTSSSQVLESFNTVQVLCGGGDVSEYSPVGCFLRVEVCAESTAVRGLVRTAEDQKV